MRLQTSWLLSSLLVISASHSVLGMNNNYGLDHKRQADESSSPAPTTTSQKRPTGSSQSEKQENSITEGPRVSEGPTPSRTTGSARRTTGNFVDPRSPPGGVVMQTPVTTSGSLYYKIGNPITFGWNYTSLLISPTALNVEAICSDNSQTYTIAQNVSVAKPSVVWDTGSFTPENDQPGLAMGIYTLVIYDEQSEVTAAPSAGRLAVFNGFKFGMYTPKPYTPLAEFECATCEKNSATSLDIVALRMLLVTATIMSVSFALFIGTIA